MLFTMETILKKNVYMFLLLCVTSLYLGHRKINMYTIHTNWYKFIGVTFTGRCVTAQSTKSSAPDNVRHNNILVW